MQSVRLSLPSFAFLMALSSILSHILASSCTYNDLLDSLGGGQCKKWYRGQLWCYINDEAECTFRRESKKGKGWSHQACQEQTSQSSSCTCTGFISSKGGGACKTRYRGKLWCYIEETSGCADERESEEVRGYKCSYQACSEENSPMQSCATQEGAPCTFPFIFKGQTFNSCTMFESVNNKPWCAVQVNKNKAVIANKWGDCSEELSDSHCFPPEFWKGIKVFQEQENGKIHCKTIHDCPDYDTNTVRSILNLGKDWNPYVSCDYETIYDYYTDKSEGDVRICLLNTGSHPTALPGGTPLRFTTSAASQGFLQHSVDLRNHKINRKRKKFLASRDPSTCRRRSFCCSVVWAGSNRQFICPRTCF